MKDLRLEKKDGKHDHLPTSVNLTRSWRVYNNCRIFIIIIRINIKTSNKLPALDCEFINYKNEMDIMNGIINNAISDGSWHQNKWILGGSWHLPCSKSGLVALQYLVPFSEAGHEVFLQGFQAPWLSGILLKLK